MPSSLSILSHRRVRDRALVVCWLVDAVDGLRRWLAAAQWVGGGWRAACRRAKCASSCQLVHAADVEGKCEGIDERLVEFLGSHCPIPVTYAGGARSFEDLATVDLLSEGKVDLTIGSALDIFGGMQVKYSDCVEWNQQS